MLNVSKLWGRAVWAKKLRLGPHHHIVHMGEFDAQRNWISKANSKPQSFHSPQAFLNAQPSLPSLSISKNFSPVFSLSPALYSIFSLFLANQSIDPSRVSMLCNICLKLILFSLNPWNHLNKWWSVDSWLGTCGQPSNLAYWKTHDDGLGQSIYILKNMCFIFK